MADNNNQGGNGSIIGIIIIILAVMWLIGSCIDTEEDHDDGKCDICGKKATYSSSDEEYCNKHLEDALEWYIEQGME